MLSSQTLVSSRSIPLSQQHTTQPLQRSSSACLNSVALPLALKRSNSGSVQSISLAHTTTDQPGTSQHVTAAASQVPSSLPTTVSPLKPRNVQDSDFKANFGTAVRTLREDIPCTLQRSPNMDIFADNISFTDNISPRMGHQANVVQGVEAYSRQLWSLRFHAALLFSRSHVGCSAAMKTCPAFYVGTLPVPATPIAASPYAFTNQVEIQRMWQRDDKTLAVRWSVQCSPRLISGVTGSKIRLDGICEYKFNDAGKVVKHTVDVINWNGLHNALGLRPSLLGAELMPTPSCFSNNSMNYAENC